jgi:uncharacterized protein
VRLTPRAARDDVDGVQDGVLRVRVSAPPVDGAANEALRRLVAGALGIPGSNVRLVTGESSRNKILAVDGVPSGTIVARWPGLRV